MTNRPSSPRRAPAIAACLAALLVSSCGGERDAGADTATSGAIAGGVDTGALRSGVPHARPQRPPRGTPRPDSLAEPQDTLDADTLDADTAGSGGLSRVGPPAGGNVRVMPWSLLTPIGSDLLRQMAARQEERFARDGRYSRESLEGRDGWSARVLFADETGWAAEATQVFYRGRSCVIWGGDASGRTPRTALEGRSGGAGTPVCDPGE